jgi:dTDP-L-rhamnose 4-epimerase
MKNILITGGAGFIGSNLALKLVKENYEVTVLDNLSTQIHGEDPEKTSPLYNSIKNKVKFILGDVQEKETLENCIKNQDIIVHLAAETGTGQSMYQIEKYCNVNIKSTAILLDILTNSKHQIKKLIVASSRAIYGEGRYSCKEHGIVYPNARNEYDLLNKDFECKCPICGLNLNLLPTSEDSKIHPTSIYGITKQNQEQMVLTVCSSIGISAIAYRYQNVYGPGQSLSNPYTGILSIFSTQIRNGNDINIFEDGEESRDFVYIDDVIDATVLGIKNDTIKQDVFNVGSDLPISVLKVAKKLRELYQSNININITGKFRLGDIRHNYADLTKIAAMLQFKPKVTFEDGITKFVEWVKLQPIVKDNYNKSIEDLKEKGLYK